VEGFVKFHHMIAFHIALTPDSVNNLKAISFVKCEQILTISKDRLVKKLG